MYLWRDKHTLEEIQAAAMLLGEPRPMLCSCCLGLQKSKAIFGYRTCPQCDGTGFDYIGRETARYAGVGQGPLSFKADQYMAEHPACAAQADRFISLSVQNWAEVFMHEHRLRRMDQRMRLAIAIIVSIAVGVSTWGMVYG